MVEGSSSANEREEEGGSETGGIKKRRTRVTLNKPGGTQPVGKSSQEG